MTAVVSPSHDEIEWQLDTDDLSRVAQWLRGRHRAGGFVPGRGAVEMHTDAYLETADGRFRRAGYALRVRRGAGRNEVTLKSLGAQRPGGKARRREISEPLVAGDIGRLGRGAGPVAQRVRAIAGRARLRKLFDVRTRRLTVPLRSVAGVHAADVALDTVAVSLGPGTRPTRFLRVEVEVVGGPVGAVAQFVRMLRRTCGLVPARSSKYEIGLRLAECTAGLGDRRSAKLAPR